MLDSVAVFFFYVAATVVGVLLVGLVELALFAVVVEFNAWRLRRRVERRRGWLDYRGRARL